VEASATREGEWKGKGRLVVVGCGGGVALIPWRAARGNGKTGGRQGFSVSRLSLDLCVCVEGSVLYGLALLMMLPRQEFSEHSNDTPSSGERGSSEKKPS